VLLKIDPRRNVVVGSTPIGFGSCGLGLGAGSLWIEDTASSTISRVSVRTGKRVAAIPVGSTPYDATFAFGHAWATSYGGGEVSKISPSRNRVIRRIPHSQAYGIVAAFGSVWATGADGVIRIDPAAGRVTARIPLAGGAGWTAASKDAVWVTTQAGVSRIDPATNAVTATVAIAGPLGDPAVVDGRLWVPQVRRNRIVLVDPAANAVAGSVKVGAGPFVVTEIRGEAWVPSWRGNDVWRLRP
jgi:DNA-binding beta-propeller fold protein YncE